MNIHSVLCRVRSRKLFYGLRDDILYLWNYSCCLIFILCFLRGLDILKRPPMAGERPWDCYRATSVINVPLDYILAYIYELDFRGEWDDMFLKGIQYQFLVSCQDWRCTTLQTWHFLTSFNPLTPKSDQHITSPHNIHTLSSKKVMRLLRLIR